MRMRTVLLSALILVLGANVAAYAANGKPLLLGKANSATKATTVKASKGPALKLKTKATAPPLAVNSTTKVTNLNADTVDGLDSSAFQKVGTDPAPPKSRAYTFTLPLDADLVGELAYQLQGVPNGKYLASYSLSTNDAGVAAYPTCYFGVGGPGATQYVRTTGGYEKGAETLSGAGVIDTAMTKTIRCEASSGLMRLDPARSSFVSLVAIDEVVPGTVTAVP